MPFDRSRVTISTSGLADCRRRMMRSVSLRETAASPLIEDSTRRILVIAVAPGFRLEKLGAQAGGALRALRGQEGLRWSLSRPSDLSASCIKARRARACSRQIQEDEAEQDRRDAAVLRGIETLRRMGDEIGERHQS